MLEHSDFSRVLAALARKKPDRVPMAELGIDITIREAFLGRPIQGLQDEVEFWQSAGYDYVLLGRSFLGLFPGIAYGKSYESKKESRDKDGGWADEKQGVISDMTEFKEYPWPDPDKADYSEFEEIGQYLPDKMKVIAYLAPIFQWIQMLMGFETFAYATIENPELIEKMFQAVGSIRLRVFENMLLRCEHIGAVWMLDDIGFNTGLMVSPTLLRKQLFPWFRKVKKLCEEKDLPLIYHSDGSYWKVTDDLLEIGVNAIHPIEPSGMGADVQRLKSRLSKKLCLVGGIDLDILTRGTADEVARETRNKIVAIGSNGGYIAGSSNSIPGSVPLENFRVMLDTVLTHGRYPLNP
jgi:uroporphyrinogen decarboxylase